MTQITCSEKYGKQSFSDLTNSLNNGEQDNEILLDAETGSGSISCIDVEPGLQVRMWDCSFTNGLEIFRQPQKDQQHRNFIVVYYLTPSSFILEDCQHSPAVINELWNTVCMRSDAKFKVQLLPGKALRCVSLHFSTAWLEKNVLCDISLQPELWQSFRADADPFVLFESLSPLERKVSEGFFDNEEQKNFGKYFWRSKALNLLTAFFEKVANRPTLQHEIAHSHELQIAAVEKQLVENIYRGLPNIKSMARKAAVTESLLKRYFRKIYGKNIYSYFQEKRMICAKQLLTEKRKTVTETASIMGYGSVSSFNNTFKRFFGLRPEKIREARRVTIEI